MSDNPYVVTGDVTLTSGRTIRLRSIPPYLYARAGEEFELPAPPVRIIKSELPPYTEEKIEMPDDPEYKRAVAEAQRRRLDAALDVSWLYGLVDAHPPDDDDWKHDIEDVLPAITWREGRRGRRLDYIQFVVVASDEDLRRIREALANLSQETEVTPALLEAQADSFRADVQGEATQEA